MWYLARWLKLSSNSKHQLRSTCEASRQCGVSNSADAHENLTEAYLADGQKDLARQYAQKVLAMLDSHAAPASSWSDTEQRRVVLPRTTATIDLCFGPQDRLDSFPLSIA